MQLRAAADLFYRPSDGRVTVDRPDPDRGDRTYTASRRRVQSLMQDRFWPTLLERTPNSFWARTNRVPQSRRRTKPPGGPRK